MNNSTSSIKQKNEKLFLTCEKTWTFHMLICIAGFFGSFTYLLRGNVFCNAQTGNVVLMGMALGTGDWKTGIYYLIPLFAYTLGAIFSELLPNPVKKHLPIRWDTLLIGIEMLFVIFLGLLPESAPVQISQVAINFIASMQYNTFRQAEGLPMATTFATNHIRQIGVGISKEFQHRHYDDKSHRIKLKAHLFMLIFFLAGATIGAFLCSLLKGRAILFTLIALGILFIVLLHADLKTEKSLKAKKPSGH